MSSDPTSLTIPDRAEFAGMDGCYESEIAPYLRSREKDRRDAATNFIILVGSLGLLALAIAVTTPFGAVSYQAAILVTLGAVGAAGWLLNRTRTVIASGLFERICAPLGFHHRVTLSRPEYYDGFRRLSLLPRHNMEAFEDEVRGSHAGREFVFCEAHLKMKTRSGRSTSVRTVFHGQLFVIDYAARFFGTTIVKRDAGLLNAFMNPGREFSRVGLASAEFEKAFEAWSTDQVEARELLDPVVLERFQELERLFKGKALRAAFAESKLLIAVETGDRLNMGSMFRPLECAARVSTILKEFDVIFDLIEVAVKRPSGRLDQAFSAAAVKNATDAAQ